MYFTIFILTIAIIAIIAIITDYFDEKYKEEYIKEEEKNEARMQ